MLAGPVWDFLLHYSAIYSKKAVCRRIANVAICTLAALASGYLTDRARAAQPKISAPEKAGDFVVPVERETPSSHRESAPIKPIAAPAAPVVQEFAKMPGGRLEFQSSQAQPGQDVERAGSVAGINTKLRSDAQIIAGEQRAPGTGEKPQSTLSPASEGDTKLHSDAQIMAGEQRGPGAGEKPQSTLSPTSEGEGMSGHASSSDAPLLKTRPSPREQQLALHPAGEKMPVGVQSYRAQDLQPVVSTRKAEDSRSRGLQEQRTPGAEDSRTPVVGAGLADSIEGKQISFQQNPPSSRSPGSRGGGENVASDSPSPARLAIEPAATPTQEEIQKLQNQLRAVPTGEFGDFIEGSPALSIVNPTGFGLDNNTGFVSGTFQQRTRYTNSSDGALGVGVGLGDARKYVGVELSYAIASFGGSRTFGSGGFNLKVHRQFPGDVAVAVGWNGFLNLGDRNDFENSVYGVATKIFRTRDDINSPFSRIAVSAGLGGGQFLSERDIERHHGSTNVFGSVAVRVARPVSFIAEWTGEDLALGLSIVPFKNLPLVITPAVRDITGAGDGPRFVLGGGFAFKF